LKVFSRTIERGGQGTRKGNGIKSQHGGVKAFLSRGYCLLINGGDRSGEKILPDEKKLQTIAVRVVFLRGKNS